MENGWHDGWPSKDGTYRCLVNGEVMDLYHFKCVINGKHHWYLGKKEEVKDKVLWKDIKNQEK